MGPAVELSFLIRVRVRSACKPARGFQKQGCFESPQGKRSLPFTRGVQLHQPHCTVRIAFPLTPFSVAVIVALPLPALLASPTEFTVAIAMSEEAHCACPLMLSIDPSLNAPIAVNCCEAPGLMLAVLGLTLIDTSVALLTVNVAVPTCPANSAEITVLPGAIPVAVP